VIGSGICGLTFAAAMHRFNADVDVQLYERDEAPDSRFQGYSLGMKGDAGIPVLRQLGVFDALRPSMAAVWNFVFCDQKGNPLLELPSSTDDKNLNLRVKRSSLKDGLRGAAPDAPIHYGTDCIRYRQTAAGIEVEFHDGRTIQAEYVVAADGVGSAMRQQLVGDRRCYLGLSCVVGSARTEVDHPLLAGGYFMMLGDSGDSVFCYRDQGGMHLSYTAHVESEDVLKAQSSEELVKLVQKATASWSAPVPQITAALDPSTIVVRGYYDKEPLKHVRDGRVWLLGDAAHPMSPFQGQGANMAMLDAWKLAQLLASATVVESDAAALEADIVGRGRKAVLESRSAARQFHTRSRIQRMNRNFGFRMANVFIKLFARKAAATAG
jgi:salicylate hydroxylase